MKPPHQAMNTKKCPENTFCTYYYYFSSLVWYETDYEFVLFFTKKKKTISLRIMFSVLYVLQVSCIILFYSKIHLGEDLEQRNKTKQTSEIVFFSFSPKKRKLKQQEIREMRKKNEIRKEKKKHLDLVIALEALAYFSCSLCSTSLWKHLRSACAFFTTKKNNWKFSSSLRLLHHFFLFCTVLHRFSTE